MSEQVHYITNEQGERVNVLLDLEVYNRLANPLALDDGVHASIYLMNRWHFYDINPQTLLAKLTSISWRFSIAFEFQIING
jgi:hypothetical protein